MSQTLKAHVISAIAPDEYYKSRFPEWNSITKEHVHCCFHDDGARPNLSIALKNGGAHCFSPKCAHPSIGNIVHFESLRLGCSERAAASKLYREFCRKVIPKKRLVAFRECLLDNPKVVSAITRDMGLSIKWQKTLGLGLDPESHRVTIPVYDPYGNILNFRMYRLPSERRSSDAAKIHNYRKGYGTLDLFDWRGVDSFVATEPVLIMASEKECMLARANGWQAVCSTSGEGSWDDSWNSVIENRDVALVFDADKGGMAAAKKLRKHFASIAKRVGIVRLVFRHKRRDRKDYADWVLKEKGSNGRFAKLVRRALRKSGVDATAPVLAGPAGRKRRRNRDTSAEVGPELPEFYDDKIHDVVDISSKTRLLNKRIRIQGIVSAKSPNTFSVPWLFNVKVKNRPAFEFAIPMGRMLLRFVRASDTKLVEAVQSLIGSRATEEITPKAWISAKEIEVIPTAAADSDAPYVAQRCYYFGERIDANVPYLMEVIPSSEIRTQETIGIITSVVQLSKSIDRFELTPEIYADLSVFQPEGEDVWAKLVGLADFVANRYTRVFNRLDWTIAALLTWCSPIGWKFPNEPELQRGWLNTLALGDTETGKSKVAKALRSLFNVGVFVSGENCTFVGLVGGAIKGASDRLMLRWGRIPLSDKQLVVVEELSGLSVTEISNMSDVRSSGVARIDKGGINSETNSRTRLLFLSNARSAKRSLSQHILGVHAVQELIGHGEDIARFDLITTLTDREVSVDVINSGDFASVANSSETISPDQFQKLIHWIWALTPEDVTFTQSAYEQCLTSTKQLAVVYHPSIPIFKGGSGRYKLGRLAAAIAAIQFSATAAGGLVVTQDHVLAGVRLLESIYRKRSLGYAEFSRQAYDRENVKDRVLLRKSFRKNVRKAILPKLLETLIHSTRFTRDELQAIGSLNMGYADDLIGAMVRERAVKKGEANVWDITPAGNMFMEKWLNKMTNGKKR